MTNNHDDTLTALDRLAAHLTLWFLIAVWRTCPEPVITRLRLLWTALRCVWHIEHCPNPDDCAHMATLEARFTVLEQADTL